MLDLQDVPKRECIGAGGGGGGVECHTPLAPAELRVAPSRLTLSRPRHTGKDPPLIKVTTDHHIIRGHIYTHIVKCYEQTFCLTGNNMAYQ